MNILQINSSVRSHGHSTVLAGELVSRLFAAAPDSKLVVRDLARTPQPMLDEATLLAIFSPAELRTPEQALIVARDDALIAEVEAADVLVVGASMYNFGISAQLKSWFDAIARIDRTFRYTANGPEGLLRGKKVFIVLARGGVYRNQSSDTQATYLRIMFAFLGMTDVQFIYAEGLTMGAEAERKGIADARLQMESLARPRTVDPADLRE